MYILLKFMLILGVKMTTEFVAVMIRGKATTVVDLGLSRRHRMLADARTK